MAVRLHIAKLIAPDFERFARLPVRASPGLWLRAHLQGLPAGWLGSWYDAFQRLAKASEMPSECEAECSRTVLKT